MGDGLLHDAGALHHLWQEHAAASEAVSHDVHAVHEWSFDHLQGSAELLASFLGVFFDVLIDTLYEEFTAERITVRVRKETPVLDGIVDSVGVELSRTSTKERPL